MHPIAAADHDTPHLEKSEDDDGAPLPRSFDPQTEYDDLMSLVSPSPPTATKADAVGDDAYQALMAKEARVLDTIDRVVNDRIVRDQEASWLFGVPIHELLMRTVGAALSLFEDLVSARSIDQVREAVFDEGRRPYLGLALIALSALIALLSLTLS